MMKRKLFLLAIVSVAFSFSLSAQISKGDPTATTIKTGNRPGKGDFGVFFGGGLMIGQDEPFILPVMNFKYFVADKIELRAGIDLYRNFNRTKGKVISGSVYADPLVTYDKATAYVDGFFNFVPGMAYHFSNLNILDVYVGAEIPFGVEHRRIVDSVSGEAAPPSAMPVSVLSWNPFVIGANLLIGVQAFIGNLPLAIGLEYGIGAKAYLGDKIKYVTENNAGDRAVYFKTDSEDAANWRKLARSSGYIDHTARLTVSYYFN